MSKVISVGSIAQPLEGRGCYILVSETRFSTLSLDRLDKGPLDPRFQVEIVSGGTNFKP
jgi:hypothetical protein